MFACEVKVSGGGGGDPHHRPHAESGFGCGDLETMRRVRLLDKNDRDDEEREREEQRLEWVRDATVRVLLPHR